VGENLNESGQVQVVVDFFGPTDLSLYAASPGLEDGYMVPFLGKDCKTDPNVYKKASPLTYVTKNAPPILILHANLDLIVPIKHSELLYNALKEAGTTVEMLTPSIMGHGGWSDADMKKAETAAYKFLDTYLKGKK
jgi:dipeptidyl aminopeptidase/acylaminoacyl peptidase